MSEPRTAEYGNGSRLVADAAPQRRGSGLIALAAGLAFVGGIASQRIAPAPAQVPTDGVAYVLSSGRALLTGPEGAHTHGDPNLRVQGCPACSRLFQGAVIQLVNARLEQLAQSAPVTSGGAK